MASRGVHPQRYAHKVGTSYGPNRTVIVDHTSMPFMQPELQIPAFALIHLSTGWGPIGDCHRGVRLTWLHLQGLKVTPRYCCIMGVCWDRSTGMGRLSEKSFFINDLGDVGRSAHRHLRSLDLMFRGCVRDCWGGLFGNACACGIIFSPLHICCRKIHLNVIRRTVSGRSIMATVGNVADFNVLDDARRRAADMARVMLVRSRNSS